MSFGVLSNPGGVPGITASVTSDEKRVWWGHENLRIFATSPQIVSTAVDAGSTPTTSLRAGLVMARVATTGLWAEYDPSQTDGREVARGVLYAPINMIGSPSGSVANKVGSILVGGLVKYAELIGMDGLARQQLSSRFVFDYSPATAAYGPSGYGWGGPMLRELNKAADYTVTANDNFTLFTASAAVNFTLPALANGLVYEFLNLADSNMTVTSAAGDDIVWDNDAQCDSLAFSTASHKIGGHLQFFTNKAATRWYVRNLSPATCTVTATT